MFQSALARKAYLCLTVLLFDWCTEQHALAFFAPAALCSLVLSSRSHMGKKKNWKLPPARAVPWKLKPLSSAITTLNRLEDGRLELTIRHSVLKGVTPEMLVWWFQHLDGNATFRGRTVPLYHLWHPTDHIQVTIENPDKAGRARVGSTLRIVEALGANLDNLIDSEAEVRRLDLSGLTLHFYEGSLRIGKLKHEFIRTSEGTQYNSRLVIGQKALSGQPLAPFLNRLISQEFGDETGTLWLKHNVEEVGSLEEFLPELYRSAGAEKER